MNLTTDCSLNQLIHKCYQPNVKLSICTMLPGKMTTGNKKRRSPVIETAIPWSHALAPLSPGGEAGALPPPPTANFNLQWKSTLSSTPHNKASCWGARRRASTWLTPGGRRVGTVSGLISLTGMEMAGERRPPLRTHTLRSLSHQRCRRELKHDRLEYQTLHEELGQIQWQVWPQSNVRALFTWWEICQVTRKHNQTERDKGMSFLPEPNQTAIKKSSG